MYAKKYIVVYVHGTNEDEVVGEYSTLEEAKRNLLTSQLVPSSFYAENSHLDRLLPHYVIVKDVESGEVLCGKNRDVKITTLGVLPVCEAHDIPDGHIFLYEDEKGEMVFHIDKREFENMVNTIFSAETGYEYSRLKVHKLKHIMESRFYNSFREGLESSLTERLAEVVIIELGSTHVDDKMFEDTRRHLLPYFMEKFHRDEVGRFAFINHENKKIFAETLAQLDRMCVQVEGHPPKFFTEEWATMMMSSAKKIITKTKEFGIQVEPIEYTSPALRDGAGKKIMQNTRVTSP